MENSLKEKLDAINEKRVSMEEYKTKKPTFQTQTTVVDGLTGEVTENKIETQFVSTAKEPPFIKLYIDDLILLNNLPTSSSNILWELISGLTYSNQIILNSSLKKRICAKLDIKMQTLDNALTKFVKKEILYRVEKGIFLPNPYLFAKGSWSEVKELRMIVDYSGNERKVKCEVNNEAAFDTYTLEEQEELNNLINQSEV